MADPPAPSGGAEDRTGRCRRGLAVWRCGAVTLCVLGWLAVSGYLGVDRASGNALVDVEHSGTAIEGETRPVRVWGSNATFTAVVKFARVKGARDFWVPWLRYWPPSVGGLTVVQYDFVAESREWRDFETCMNATRLPPRFETIHFDRRVHVWAMEKNSWKFLLDRKTDADVLALFDDDACLLTHFVPEDWVVDGKLIVHGTDGGMGEWRADNWIEWLGLQNGGYFMTDFPVLIWREMLADLRKWMVKRALNETLSFDPDTETDQTWRAFQVLFQQHFDWALTSEFNLIMNFAYTSPKWRSRYNWRVVPHGALSLGIAVHSKRGCPPDAMFDQDVAQPGSAPQRLREMLMCYPYNNLAAYNPDSKVIEPKKRILQDFPYAKLSYYKSYYPRCPVPDLRFLALPRELTPASAQRGEFEALLGRHRANVDARRRRGMAMSYEEAHAGITKEWSKCFVAA